MQARDATRLALLLLTAALLATPARAADPVVPLPPEIAKDLELLGDGVVGKALPAPPIEDVTKYFHADGGSWKYRIVEGDEDQKVRHESYTSIDAPGGSQAWKRQIGETFVEYVRVNADGSFGKYAEDDLDLGYGCLFEPGITLPANLAAGDVKTIDSELKAFKLGHPHDIEYTGKMTSRVRYVGAYEVTTPAGTFPAVLVQSRFDIAIGPAKVSDTTYLLYAKGAGKVAEIESLKVSALLIYHSNDKTAKVMVSGPGAKAK